MKKALAVAAALVAATVLALPWMLGTQARTAHENLLTQLQSQGARVIDSDFRGGWLSSEASVRIELPYGPPQTAPKAAAPISLKSRISHGPWPLDSPRLLPSAALIESRAELSLPGSVPPPLLLTTRVELDGSGAAQIRLPPVPSTTAGSGLQTAQGDGELRFAPGFSQVRGRLALPSLSLSADAGYRLELRGLQLEASGSRWIAGLATGQATLKLGRAELRTPRVHLQATGLSATGKTIPEGTLLSLELAYRAEELSVNGVPYGPSQFSFSLQRLPGDVLASLQDSMRALSDNPMDQSLIAVTMAAIMAEHVPLFLAADPELALGPVEITTPQGQVRGRLSLASQGLTREMLEKRGAWVEHLAGEAELTLPHPLALRLLEEWEHSQTLEQLHKRGREAPTQSDAFKAEIAAKARERLAVLVRQRWLVESGGGFRIQARLTDALLTLNGKTIPVGVAAAP